MPGASKNGAVRELNDGVQRFPDLLVARSLGFTEAEYFKAGDDAGTAPKRDGQPEPFFIESMSNGVRINTGSNDVLPVPADITFTLRYRTTRPLGFFDTHDDIYWNVTGLGLSFPIEQVQASRERPSKRPPHRRA